jgi:hypothetical protein
MFQSYLYHKSSVTLSSDAPAGLDFIVRPKYLLLLQCFIVVILEYLYLVDVLGAVEHIDSLSFELRNSTLHKSRSTSISR